VQSEDGGLGVGKVGIVCRVVEVLVQPSHTVETVIRRHCDHGPAAIGELDDFVIGDEFAELRGGYTDVVVCWYRDVKVSTKSL